MDAEKIKKDKLRKKAEEVLEKRFNRIKNQSEHDQYIHELRVHQIELEIQNEELRETQIKLEESRRKYFDLYNFAPVGYFTLDKDGIILEVNLAGAALLGVERLILNRTAFIQYIAPDHRNKFYTNIRKVLETKTKQTVELKLLNQDFDDYFYMHLETINVEDDGNFKEFRITVTDIKNLKNTEKALKESEELSRLIFNQSPIGSIIMSLDYSPLQVNEALCNMFGYSKEELLSMTFHDYTYPEDLDADLKQRKLLIEGTIENFKMEKRYIHKNGEILWGNLSVSAVKDQTGTLVRILSMVEDITQKKHMEKIVTQRTNNLANINRILNIEIGDYENAEIKLESLVEKLKVSNKELEQFAYVSSHDLKEPLRMITSFLQLLKQRYEDNLDEEANEFIDYAVEGAKRLDMMINDLLEYSRMGSQKREFKNVDSEKILEIVLTNLNLLIKDNNAIITHDPLPVIYANDQQMILLFQNLIGNAIKYRGKEDPKIYISADKVEDEYIFKVKDNGIGIDQQHLERIFTIFQRLHSREEYEGTGIGLAITKKILQQHNGDIWAESKPGKGTTFKFTIPLNNKNHF